MGKVTQDSLPDEGGCMDVGLGVAIGVDVLVVETLHMAERSKVRLERRQSMPFCLVGIGDRHRVDARIAEGHSKQMLKNGDSSFMVGCG
jgi:hypothetical protein